MKELRVLSPTAILGYGFPVESFEAGMAKKPHVIAVDAGSTDPGPCYLGALKSFTDKTAVKRDLEYMILAALKENIPVIIGTAGGCGAWAHLDWNVDIIKEIAAEKGLEFKLAIIPSDIDKELVRAKLKENAITPLNAVPALTEEELDKTTTIVAQMGVEPFVKALEEGAQVIVAGRTYDPSVFAALPVKEGFDVGLAMHMGKILECAAIAAVPGSGADCMMGYLREDHFELEPLSDKRKCTCLSVAAHTLYEKSDPYKLPGPGGLLDLTNTTYTQNKENSVIVKGSRFVETEGGYTVKLEGVKPLGYRTISIAATRDPIMIAQIDKIVEDVKKVVKTNFAHFRDLDFFLDFKIYGQNGVMDIFKNKIVSDKAPQELAIIIEAVAKDESTSATICSFARSTMLHYGYEGRKSTAGNLAFPYSPSDVSMGSVYEFSIYHLMDIDNGLEHFPITIKTCKKGELV